MDLTFAPTSHDIRHELRFERPASVVCALLDPTHEALLEPGARVEPLISSPDRNGAVYRLVTPHNGGRTLILLHHLEPDGSEIRYSIVYGEVEKLAISCHDHPDGGAVATRIYKYGNQDLQIWEPGVKLADGLVPIDTR